MRAGRQCSLGLLVALAACAVVGPARGQAPLTANDFNIDAVTGPVLAADRVVALGGAFTALAYGIDGAAWNPAAYATRSLWEPNWFEWDATAGLQLAGLFRRNDYFNNGAGEGIGTDDFLFFNTGLRLQFNKLGIGGLFNLQDYAVETSAGKANASMYAVQYGGAWMFFDGQLVTGLSARTVGMTIRYGGQQLVNFSGTGAELGAVWAPDGWRLRIGAAGRTPVESGRMAQPGETPGAVDVEAGLVLPRRVLLPWEAQLGVAFQFGERPLNRRWSAPLDPRYRQVIELKQRWCARAREQALREVREEQGSTLTVGECPRLRRKPRDRRWWRAERARREVEEAQMNQRIEEERDALRQRLREQYEALPRFYWLVTADVLVLGPARNAVGIDAFLDQERRPSGRYSSVGARFGTEVEPWLNRLKLRLGGYLEPARSSGVDPRMHGTAGLDVRLFTWDLFGAMEPFSVRLGGMVDVAKRYFNWGIGIGLWH